MKTAAIILSVLGWLAVAGAQTNEAVIPILTAGSQSFTNARITHVTPAYAVVSCNAGIVQVALSNLPVACQQEYDYDPTNAANYLAEKKQEEIAARNRMLAQQVAYHRYVASLAGTNQPVRVLAIKGQSPYWRCAAETETGVRDIYLNTIPDSVRDFISRLDQLRRDVVAYEDRVDDFTRAARHADATAPASTILYTGGNSADANGAMSQRARANLMMNQARDMSAQLQKMKDNLAMMESQAVEKTTVLAYPTGRNYGQLELWNCIGLPGRL